MLTLPNQFSIASLLINLACHRTLSRSEDPTTCTAVYKLHSGGLAFSADWERSEWGQKGKELQGSNIKHYLGGGGGMKLDSAIAQKISRRPIAVEA
jgi:hypothetical protein